MILRRYMTHQVASTTALVLGFLVVMMLGGRLIRYFGIAAEGGLDVSILFTIIGYNLPYFLELILPLAFFIALMLVFGRLYVDQEMAVINASGVSRGRLARLMTPLIMALFISEAVLSLVGKPWGVRASEAVWQQQALSSAFDLIRPNEFISSGDYHLYVGSLSEDKTQLQDVILIQSERTEPRDASSAQSDQADAAEPALGPDQRTHTDTADMDTDIIDTGAVTPPSAETSPSLDAANDAMPELPQAVIERAQQVGNKDTITLAKRAQQVDNGDEANDANNANKGLMQLDLYQGRRYEIGADSLKYNQVSFDRYRITLVESKQEVMTEDDIETQAIVPLWQAATGHSAVADEDALRAAQGELGYRLALPWLMIIAPMLAVPLAQVRPRQGRWLRLFPSVLLFVSCAMGIISLKSAVASGSVSVWGYAWLILAFMALALYLNWASRIKHRLRFSEPATKSQQTSGGQA